MPPCKRGIASTSSGSNRRSVSERVEIAAVDATAGTLSLSSPLHWTLHAASPYLAQIAKVSPP